MSNSNSSMPTIIVAAVVIAVFVIAFIADRSGGGEADLSSITHTADTDKMIKSKAKYEQNKSVFSHSGYSGSLEGYLKQAKQGGGTAAGASEQVSYSGSGEDYVQKYQNEEDSSQKASADDHSGYSGGLKDYLAGKFEKRTTEKMGQKSKSSHSATKTVDTDGAYVGDVDDYLKKYGN